MTQPSQSIVFADAAEFISNPDDQLRRLGGIPCHRLRLFSRAERYGKVIRAAIIPARCRRHGKQVNAAFFDGHVLKLRNSDIGYNLLRTDPAALWPKNNKPNGP